MDPIESMQPAHQELAGAPERSRHEPFTDSTEESGDSSERLFDFEFERSVRDWYSIDDRVMGGVSRSSLEHRPGVGGVFRGELSLDQGGGFASVRCLPAGFDLGGRRGVELRVRGDGRSYQLRMRTDGGFDGPNHCATFEAPADTWTTVRIPFDDFRATRRGRLLEEVEPLAPEKVRTFGLMVADRQAGAFRLEVAWIDAY